MTQPAAPGEAPDLLYRETENDLRNAVRDFYTERCPATSVLARIESGEPYDLPLWHALAAELGCGGLLVPESAGGAGASYREAAVVAEETGRSVAPVPYLGSAVVATAALLAATGPEPASDDDRKLLAALAEGSVTAALAVPFETAPGTTRPVSVRVVGAPAEAGARLTGTVTGVADALPADVLLVPGDGVPYGLYAVDARAGGVTKAPVVSLDSTRLLCDLTLDAAPARRIVAGAVAGTAEIGRASCRERV